MKWQKIWTHCQIQVTEDDTWWHTYTRHFGLSISHFHLLGIIVFVFWSMINLVVSTQNISNKNPIKMNISSRILEWITITLLQSFFLSYIKKVIVTYHNVTNVFSSGYRMMRLLWQRKYHSFSDVTSLRFASGSSSRYAFVFSGKYPS